MKALVACALLICAPLPGLAENLDSTVDEFRIFAFEPTGDDRAVGLADFRFQGVWAITNNVGVTDFILFHLRDGTEFGRQVPTLRIYRKGAIFGLAIVDEKNLQAATFTDPRVLPGDIFVFEVEADGRRRTIKIPLIWRPDAKLIFAARRGIEWPSE